MVGVHGVTGLIATWDFGDIGIFVGGNGRVRVVFLEFAERCHSDRRCCRRRHDHGCCPVGKVSAVVGVTTHNDVAVGCYRRCVGAIIVAVSTPTIIFRDVHQHHPVTRERGV